MTTTPEQLRQLAEHLDFIASEEYEGNLAPGNVSMKRLLETSIALSAAADQLEAGVKVKPLEWKPKTLGFEAETVFGKFEVMPENYSGKWFWCGELGAAMDQPCGKSPDSDAGMQAVEDEIKRRILSAIQGDGE